VGYSHYGGGNVACTNETWAQVLADAQKVAAASGIPIAGGSGKGKPIFNNDKICFNGKGDRDSHETFQVERPGGWDFTKTARKPYNIVVCAVVMVIKHYIPTFTPSSDGDPDEWADAVKLCQDTLGYGVYPCGDEVDTPVEAPVKPSVPPTDEQLDTVITVSRVKPQGE
jgi:hypothetical protein